MCIKHALTAKGAFSAVVEDHFRVGNARKTLSQNMCNYDTITHNTDPNINTELLLVSSTDCTKWFRLCPLISVADICDAIFTRSCLDYGEHW